MTTDTKRLPGSLRRDTRLDSWITIDPSETITVRTGKVEIGQGITTAVQMIAAEELDVGLERIRVISGATSEVVDENVTSGSSSMEETGRAMRQAAAEARAFLLARAAEALEADAGVLSVEDGVVKAAGSNRQVTYWELLGGKAFGIEATGEAKPKPPSAYRLAGTVIPQRDARAKVTGAPVFVHDMRLDGMLHARVVRPPSYEARLKGLTTAGAEAIVGVVKVVRSGSFVAVIAESEWAAMRARAVLAEAAVWDEPATLPDEEQLYAWHLENETMANPVIEGVAVDEAAPEIGEPPANAAKTLEAMYGKPYFMHGSLGPSAAVALFAEGKLKVWSPSQGPYPLRTALSGSLGMAADDITVLHTQGAGCYGHNGADDVSLDAALLAREVPGRPVKVQWTREDEHRWEPYGPAQVVMTRASLDGSGRIMEWNLDLWSTTHQGRPRPTTAERSSFVADWHREPARARPKARQNFSKESAAHRNAKALYEFDKTRVVSHFVEAQPLRTSSLRGLGNFANIFAIECFMDELAEAAGKDAVQFRLDYLKDGRARAVLEAAAEGIGWRAQTAGSGRGTGIAVNRYKNSKGYAAVACEVEADAAKGTYRITKAVIAGDAGQIVNRAALSNQLEGGFLQAASWMQERVRFDPVRVTSTDWEGYPIMRMPDVPEVQVILINQPGGDYLGIGEGSQAPAGAAIGNALYFATGVRMRELPFTPERVRRMISGAA
ncbi:MAG: hypothetical protein RLZ98_2277 [Pseudomonadota bacterium]|jgi:CO/xanthine dehydrogenase Mo-binding subunit